MAALFGASEEGNLQGIKDLVEMAQNIDLLSTNKVNMHSIAKTHIKHLFTGCPLS